MDQLALIPRTCHRAVIGDDKDFCKGDRCAHGGRIGVDQSGIEIGRPECLGQAVHRVDIGIGKIGPQRPDEVGRQCAAAVREPPHRSRGVARPVELRQLDPQRRHRSERRDAMPGAGFHHVAREEIVERRHAAAGIPRGEQLVLAIIEAQRQDCQSDVVAGQLEVMGHADGTQPQVRMAQHDALGPAGAAAGVEDCRQGVRIGVGGGQRCVRLRDVIPQALFRKRLATCGDVAAFE